MPLKHDYSEAMLNNTNAAVDALADEISERARGEYAADQARQTFWREFYSRWPSLRAHAETVAAILNEQWDTVSKLTAEEAVEHLGEAARERVAQKERNAPAEREAAVYSYSNETEAKFASVAPTQPGSLGSIIRDRRERRRAGRSYGSPE